MFEKNEIIIIKEVDEELTLNDFVFFQPYHEKIFLTAQNLKDENYNLGQENIFRNYLDNMMLSLINQSQHNQQKLNELIEIIDGAKERDDLKIDERILAIVSKSVEIYGIIRHGMKNFLGIKILEMSDALTAIRKLFVLYEENSQKIHSLLYKGDEQSLSNLLQKKITKYMIDEVLKNTENKINHYKI